MTGPDDRDYRPEFKRPGRPDGEVDAEFQFHLEARIRALVEQGWEPAAARTEALRRFGDIDDARRYCEQTDKRRMTRMLRMEYGREFLQDLAYAARSLRKAPAFTFFAVLTLALGIGANTSIFSVVRGILLRPMPFAAPEQLVTLWASSGGRSFPYFSPLNLTDIRAQNHTLSAVAFYGSDDGVLTGRGDPVRLQAADINADMFQVLGVRPIAGRITFTAGEDTENGANAVLLNESLWRTRFGGDTSIVGTSITLDGKPYPVVGIVPADAAWPATAQVWYPLQINAQKVSRGAVYIQAVGRVKPGVTVAEASADVHAIMSRLAEQYPGFDKGMSGEAREMREALTGPVEQPLIILLGAVTLVLLIACVNVANLLMVRGVGRAPEMAVRAALGAGRGRLARQLITESLLLALLGGVAGVAVGWLATRGLVSIAPASIPRLDAVHMDGTVLGVALLVTLVTGLVFGLVPARQVARADVSHTLREGGRGGAGGRASARARTTLVVAEVALAVMLVVGAGLLVQSFRRLMDVDPGFHAENVVSFAVSLPGVSYPDPERLDGFGNDLLTRLKAQPGVRDAGLVMALPLTPFGFGFTFTVAEHPKPPEGEEPDAQVRVASPGYFTTLGVPIVRGRGFTDFDRAGANPVLLITEAAAKQFFPNDDPIGKHVEMGWGDGHGHHVGGEIVGVVRDVKQSSLATAARPQMYVPFAQRPVSSFSVVLRATGDPSAVLRGATEAVHAIDQNLAVTNPRTMESVVSASVAQPRFYMTLLAAFAGLALLLSAIGIYGVIAYIVGQRSREIGIRIALGASGAQVLRMVMRQGVAMTVIGVAIGIGGALALTKFMGTLLFNVTPTDAATYGTTVGVLVGVAALASLVPALRAAREDPTVAMRAE
ncbi:MAG TPA: ABC transporter permease [Gemmatimonadaceae bacterium]|nr:ABC transporter permease [Gemmatimonadaceae bacterium]